MSRNAFFSNSSMSSEEGSVLLFPRRKVEDADMDITPMIDVTFLLLIFFLVCSTINQQSSIILPEAKTGDAIDETTATIFLVDGNGDNITIRVGNDSASPLTEDPEEQKKTLVEAIERGLLEGKRRVLIKASSGVYLEEISRITEAVREIPDIELHLAVDEI